MSSQPSVIPLAILSLCIRATRSKIKQRKERFQNDENKKVMGVTTTIQTTDPCLLLVPPPNIHHQQVSKIQKWHSVAAQNPSLHPSPLKQPQLLSKTLNPQHTLNPAPSVDIKPQQQHPSILAATQTEKTPPTRHTPPLHLSVATTRLNNYRRFHSIKTGRQLPLPASSRTISRTGNPVSLTVSSSGFVSNPYNSCLFL